MEDQYLLNPGGWRHKCAATCESVIQAGANVLVVGSAIFDGVDPKAMFESIKRAVGTRRED
ncbi:MAG: hypothetical protein ACLR23_04920 [Clostridia bacterium]